MMIFLKLLLSSGLIFIAATAFTRNESLCSQTSEYVKPMHYNIKLTSYIEENIFYEEYNISINILNKTQHIYLHSEKFCIENIVLFTNFERYHENDKNTVFKPKIISYYIEVDTIDILFMDELSPGNYTLNIKYVGTYFTADKGFRIFDMKQKFTWIGTPRFQIIGARQVSPCWHSRDLLLEATFNISIGCTQCTALSNMPLRNMEKNENNLLWTHFDTTPVMSPYLATMIVSNYLLRLDYKTTNINMWCRNESRLHIEFAKNIAEHITLFFKNEWKHSNNISTVNHVAIPNFHEKGTIVFGLVLYRETDIIYHPNLYSLAHDIEVAQLVARKVTQQWFNNLMNNPDVSDFWFKKGLTILLAAYAVNKTYSDNRIKNLFVVQNQHYSFNLDGDYHIWPSTSQVNSSLEIPNSIRAPFILRMMKHVITEEIFWKGIRSYVNGTEFSPSPGPDFMDLMRRVAETMNLDNVSQTIDYWAVEKHCPLIKIIRNYSHPISQTNISIQNIDTLNIDCLPITFTTQTYTNFTNFSHITLCKRPRHLISSLTFKEDGWMIFNIQQIGYYRVNYDDENWRRISNYINSDDYTKIHVLNRAQIIDDAFHLMIAGQLNSSIFWNITLYLHREDDYIAWYPMFKALEYMFGTLRVTMLKDKNWSFKNTIIQTLQQVLKRIKYEEIDDIDELRICLRQEAARWACNLGDSICKIVANNKLKQHLQDPKKHKLLPWWKEWTYCKGLMRNTKDRIATWQLVYDIGLEKSDTKFLEYLACPEDANLIKVYLNKTFKQNISTEQKYPNSFNSFLHIITKRVRNRIILDYIFDYLRHIDIRPKDFVITAALIIIINNVYSEILVERINLYVDYWWLIQDFHDGMKKKDFIIQNYDKIESKILIRKDQIKRQSSVF